MLQAGETLKNLDITISYYNILLQFQMQADGKPDPSYRMKKNQQGQYIPLSQSEGQ